MLRTGSQRQNLVRWLFGPIRHYGASSEVAVAGLFICSRPVRCSAGPIRSAFFAEGIGLAEPGRKEARAPRRPHRRRWQPSSPMPAPRRYQRIPVSKIRPCAPWSRVYGPSVTSTLPSGCFSQRLCVGGRGNAAGELPHAGSNQFAVKRVDLLDHRFGYGGRVEVVGEVVSNQILWHDFFSLVSVVVSDDSFPVHSGAVAHRSVAYSRWGDGKSTATPNFYFSCRIRSCRNCRSGSCWVSASAFS